MPETVLVIAFSFIVGAIPFGVLFTKSQGIDLKKVGSGNIGATNVLRVAGKKVALMTLMGDILKGTAAVALARAVGGGTPVEGMAGLAAVLGHDFSPFMRFRGGKGVATSLGVVLIYTPIAGILTVILWLLTVITMRYSSIGAIVSFLLMPVWILLLDYPPETLYIAVIISVLLVAKHSGNIKRLLKGTEGKIGNKGNK
jgi:glycerol-3-phosphate acyltransferase PlsY